MDLGVIVYTEKQFEKRKIPFIQRCLNSIYRQKVDNVKIKLLVMDDNEIVNEIKNSIDADIIRFKEPAKAINKCIKELDCSHFIIVRYDTIFAPNSINEISACKNDEGILLNFTSKKDKLFFEPFFKVCDVNSQLEKAPFVWNVVFSKEVVIKNKLSFENFSLYNQYLFLINYICCGNLIESENINLCLDRTIHTKRLSNKFIKQNFKLICQTAKFIQKSRNSYAAAAFVRDICVPLTKMRYNAKGIRNRFKYSFMCIKFMRIIIGGNYGI